MHSPPPTPAIPPIRCSLSSVVFGRPCPSSQGSSPFPFFGLNAPTCRERRGCGPRVLAVTLLLLWVVYMQPILICSDFSGVDTEQGRGAVEGREVLG